MSLVEGERLAIDWSDPRSDLAIPKRRRLREGACHERAADSSPTRMKRDERADVARAGLGGRHDVLHAMNAICSFSSIGLAMLV
jgi:hypothetical protein